MPLKEAKGNMYGFVTHTWCPVKGKCGFGCTYCYVARIASRFRLKPSPLHLDKKELKANLGHGNYIFICSGCDLFHPDVPDDGIADVHSRTLQFPGNNYLWHTKNPKRLVEMIEPGPCDIACITIESNEDYPGISGAPIPRERAKHLRKWKGRKMITVEPILRMAPARFAEMILGCGPEQVNIGADSGGNNLPEPSIQDIEWFIDLLKPHTKVVLKDNLRRIYPRG